MASSSRGKLLTDAARRQQVRNATAAASALRRSSRLLDLSDLDRSSAGWIDAMVAHVGNWGAVAQNDAAKYVVGFRIAETGSGSGPLRSTLQRDLQSLRGTLEHIGPVSIKRKISEGIPAEVAYEAALKEAVAASQKTILASGRGVVRESSRANPKSIGWRRVSDGDPCTFCAMLVSRGPAYTEYAKALAKGNGDPYHNHCGCGVEEVFHDWTPSELEQQFVDAYYEAAEAANAADQPRLASTVLWRMRAEGEFRDSPLVRNKITDLPL